MNDEAMTSGVMLSCQPFRRSCFPDGGRTVVTLLRTLAIVSLFVTPARAQSVAAPERGGRALDVFFRVAASIGQQKSVFRRSWPQVFEARGTLSALRLTAADRLVVHTGANPESRDTTERITGVRLWRDVPDTGALRQLAIETEQELTLRFGPPVECSDPLGAPSHLFVPQHVTRFWPRGIQGQEMRMSWTVSLAGKADLELYAGVLARSADHTLRCDARLP